MNSGGASAGGSTGVTLRSSREESSCERAGEAAAELWLALSQRATLVESLPADRTETPSAWRAGAGDLTPGSSTGVAQGGAPAEAASAERLTLRVDGGELGELAVVLDRHEGALRVVIGLENQRFVGQVLPDARALRLALEGAGLNVHSLSVVTTSEVGTVLAQRRLSPSGQEHEAGQDSSEHPEKPQRHKSKRLTLIG